MVGKRFPIGVILTFLLCVLMVCTVQAEVCDHHYVRVEVPSDCINPGFTYLECTKCGEQKDYQTIPPKGHDFAGWGTDRQPSCTEPGSECRTCRRCGHQEQREIPAAGHVWGEEITEPTCTKDGVRRIVCTVCGKRNGSEPIPALGHCYDEGVITKEPTTRHMGKRTFTCTRCGKTRTEDIPRLEPGDPPETRPKQRPNPPKNPQPPEKNKPQERPGSAVRRCVHRHGPLRFYPVALQGERIVGIDGREVRADR